MSSVPSNCRAACTEFRIARFLSSFSLFERPRSNSTYAMPLKASRPDVGVRVLFPAASLPMSRIAFTCPHGVNNALILSLVMVYGRFFTITVLQPIGIGFPSFFFRFPLASDKMDFLAIETPIFDPCNDSDAFLAFFSAVLVANDMNALLKFVSGSGVVMNLKVSILPKSLNNAMISSFLANIGIPFISAVFLSFFSFACTFLLPASGRTLTTLQ
mmetsp:Transcript_47912/g.150286  ORF Transcript_47912/g.150286 Transcript_47912/m.150286 type:complete len:215 (+) Transcript_47912:277-921(+)